MEYCRIDLSKSNYIPETTWNFIRNVDIDELNLIYKKYCEYKKFASVVPIFDSQYTDINNDIIGYYEESLLIGFSLVHRFDTSNAECIQFAWDYNNPKIRLGIASLKTECAVYKLQGFKYLYIGCSDPYKEQIQGYEIIGKL